MPWNATATEPGLQLTKVLTLEQGQRERTNGLLLQAEPVQAHPLRSWRKWPASCERYPGSCPVFLYVQDAAGKWLKLKAGDSFKVNPGSTVVKSDLETILGVGLVEFSRSGNHGNGNGR